MMSLTLADYQNLQKIFMIICIIQLYRMVQHKQIRCTPYVTIKQRPLVMKEVHESYWEDLDRVDHHLEKKDNQ